MSGCAQRVAVHRFRIWVSSSQDLWSGVGDVLQISGGQEIDIAMTIERATGNAVAIPGVASIVARAEVPSLPSAATGSYTGTQGTTHHDFDLSTTTDKYMARVGVLAKLSGGTTDGWVEGTISIVLRRCAVPIGQRSLEVSPDQSTGSPSPSLLGIVPASGADKLRAALVCNAINDVEYLFQVRGMNDPDAPGAWTALGTWTALTNGNSAVCHADVSVSGVTPGSWHLLQYAIALRLKTGGSNPAGFLKVAASQSYA
jgi:hypothetical protein